MDLETEDAQCTVRGTTAMGCSCQKQMHVLPIATGPPSLSKAMWEDKGDNKPQGMFAAEQRAILVSKSVYLEHSCFEESLPLVEM